MKYSCKIRSFFILGSYKALNCAKEYFGTGRKKDVTRNLQFTVLSRGFTAFSTVSINGHSCNTGKRSDCMRLSE